MQIQYQWEKKKDKELQIQCLGSQQEHTEFSESVERAEVTSKENATNQRILKQDKEFSKQKTTLEYFSEISKTQLVSRIL